MTCSCSCKCKQKAACDCCGCCKSCCCCKICGKVLAKFHKGLAEIFEQSGLLLKKLKRK